MMVEVLFESIPVILFEVVERFETVEEAERFIDEICVDNEFEKSRFKISA